VNLKHEMSEQAIYNKGENSTTVTASLSMEHNFIMESC